MENHFLEIAIRRASALNDNDVRGRAMKVGDASRGRARGEID